MGSLGKVHTNNGTAGYCQLFGLAGPAAGASTVLVSSTVSGSLSSGSMSFTGVDQATPVGTAVTNIGSSTAPSATVTGTTAGNQVAAVVANGSPITSSGQTSRYIKNLDGNSAAGNGAGASAAAGGSVAMGWTVTNDWWGVIAVEVKAGAAAAVVQPPPQFNRVPINRASLW